MSQENTTQALIQETTNLPKSQLKWKQPIRLPENNDQLASLLEMDSAKQLTWLGQSKSKHYTILKIPKANGSSRIIHNPDQTLRLAQYNILVNILEYIDIPDYVFAFEKKKSIPEMASIHVGKRLIVSIDIKDFFTSIKQNRVYDLLQGLGVASLPARTISELCTYGSFVPQGALTSPKVANMVTAATFGPEIKTFCDSLKLTLTIYADDITISSNEEFDVAKVINFVRETLSKYRFRVNNRKTKIMFPTGRQYVCGVVVNKKTNLIRNKRLELRAIVHNIVTNGVEAEAAKSELSPDEFIRRTQGRLNWFKQLNPTLGGRYCDQLKLYLDNLKNQIEVIPPPVQNIPEPIPSLV